MRCSGLGRAGLTDSCVTHQCALSISNIVRFWLLLLSYRVPMPDTVSAPTKSERANRARLVERFNELVGAPHPAVCSMQLQFISGELTEHDEWEFRGLYERAVDEMEVAMRPEPPQ